MRFAIFPLHLSKVLRLPRKSDARSCEVLHLSRKIILANLQIWCSKMQPLSGNQRPDLLTSLMNMSLVLRLPRKMHLCRSSSKCPTPVHRFGNATKPSRFAHFWQGAQSLAPATRNDIWTSKSGPSMSVLLHILTSKCASRHKGVHFFDISTSKSGPSMVLYILTSKCASRHNGVHFFDISTFKSAPNHEVLCSFFTCKCASRHNGVQFSSLIWPAWLRTRRFSEPTFRPSGAYTNHWKKTQCFATFLPFRAPGSSFFWDFLFFDLLSSSLLFSDSSHLCFSSVHIVRSLTSKLPSMMIKPKDAMGFPNLETAWYSHLQEGWNPLMIFEANMVHNVMWCSMALQSASFYFSHWQLPNGLALAVGFQQPPRGYPEHTPRTTWTGQTLPPSAHDRKSQSPMKPSMKRKVQHFCNLDVCKTAWKDLDTRCRDRMVIFAQHSSEEVCSQKKKDAFDAINWWYTSFWMCQTER